LGEEHDKHNKFTGGSSVLAAMFVEVGVEDGGVRTKALRELRSKWKKGCAGRRPSRTGRRRAAEELASRWRFR
jgi:hypothetical protein